MKRLLFLTLLSVMFVEMRAQHNKIPVSRPVWIKEVSVANKTTVLRADYVTILTGAKAVKAARLEGDAEFDINAKGDTVWYVPNDLYIENRSQKLRTLPVADSCIIQLIREGGSRLYKSNLAQLKKGYADKLYELVIASGTVIKITEVYTP